MTRRHSASSLSPNLVELQLLSYQEVLPGARISARPSQGDSRRGRQLLRELCRSRHRAPQFLTGAWSCLTAVSSYANASRYCLMRSRRGESAPPRGQPAERWRSRIGWSVTNRRPPRTAGRSTRRHPTRQSAQGAPKPVIGSPSGERIKPAAQAVEFDTCRRPTDSPLGDSRKATTGGTRAASVSQRRESRSWSPKASAPRRSGPIRHA